MFKSEVSAIDVQMEPQSGPPPVEEPSPQMKFTTAQVVEVDAPVGGSHGAPGRCEIGAVRVDVSLEDFEITSAGLDHDSKGLFRAATKPESRATKGLGESYFIKRCADEETFLQGMDRARLLTSMTDGASHPNVAVVEFGFKGKVGDDPAYYIAMPWYPMTVHEWFTAHSGQVENLPEMIRVLSEMVSGLSWLHSQGLFREGSTPVQIWMDSAELLAKPKWLAVDCSPIPQGVLPTSSITKTFNQLLKVVKTAQGRKCRLSWTLIDQLVHFMKVGGRQRPESAPLHPKGGSREGVSKRLHDIQKVAALELKLGHFPPQRYVDAFEGNLSTSTAWYGLGVLLKAPGEEAEIKGKRYGHRECFVEALQCDPRSCVTWFELGMATDGVVTVNHASYRKVDCFVESLRIDPKIVVVWSHLGASLALGETILLNGAAYTNRMCYAASLRLNPTDPSVWNNLGAAMNASESITVLGRDFTKRDCFVEALKYDPEDAVSWKCLSLIVSDSEQVLVNGVYYTKRQCCAQALTFNPLDAVAWEILGCSLPADGKASVKDKSYTRRECFLQALRLNPKRQYSWANLATTMKPREKVSVHGTPYTQRECLVNALNIDPKLVITWRNLGNVLAMNDMIVVDGMSYTKRDCMAKYEELCKNRGFEFGASPEGCQKSEHQVGVGDVDGGLLRLRREAESGLQRTTLHRWFDWFFFIHDSPTTAQSMAKRRASLEDPVTVIRSRLLVRSHGGRAKLAVPAGFFAPRPDRINSVATTTLVHGRSPEDNLQLVEAVHRSRVQCLGVKAIPTAEFLGSYCFMEGIAGGSPSTAATSDYFLHGGAGFPFPPLPVHRPSGQLMSPALLSAIQMGGLNGGGNRPVPVPAGEALHQPPSEAGVGERRLEVQLYVAPRLHVLRGESTYESS